jgi:hypothetical protein
MWPRYFSSLLGLGYPNYIIRGGVIGVVEEVDGQYQYRVLQGSLTQPMRNVTQEQLNVYQSQ